MKPRKQTETEVIQAAVKWWEGIRPYDWDAAKHIEYPAINCICSSEHQPATAVGKLMRERVG